MRRYLTFALAVVTGLLVSGELAFSLPIMGIGPDLVVIVVASFAIGERPRSAAIAGFGAGLAKDMLVSTPAGLTAFAYAITAYALALGAPGVSRRAGPLIATIAGASLMSQLIYGLGAVLLAQRVDAAPIPRIVLVTTAYNALLTPLLIPFLRRVILSESAAQPGD